MFQWPRFYEPCFISTATNTGRLFGLTTDDIARIKTCDVIIAADGKLHCRQSFNILSYLISHHKLVSLFPESSNIDMETFHYIQTRILDVFSVIYDFDLTDAFFTTVTGLLKHNPPKQLYMGLEKRQVLAVTHFKITIVYEWFELGGLSFVSSTVTSRPSPTEIDSIGRCVLNFNYSKTWVSIFSKDYGQVYTYIITITSLKVHFKYKQTICTTRSYFMSIIKKRHYCYLVLPVKMSD